MLVRPVDANQNWMVTATTSQQARQATNQSDEPGDVDHSFDGQVTITGELTLEEEYEVGERHEEDLVERYGVWDDDLSFRRLEKVAAELLPLVSREDVDYDFDLLDTPLAFASACPNGTVLFSRGLMEAMPEHTQLLFFGAHELTHTDKRHYASRQKRFDEVRRLVGYTRTVQERQILELAALAAVRHQEEYEADLGAVKLLAELGHESSIAWQTLERLQKVYEQVSPEALTHNPLDLSSHPTFQDRVNRLKEGCQGLPDPQLLLNQMRAFFSRA